MPQNIEYFQNLASSSPVIAVLTIEQERDAIPLAQALVAGGLTALEITLRTPVALKAIRLIAENIKSAVPGAGTVLDAHLLEKAKMSGAHFAVSPGVTQDLLTAAEQTELAFLPGVSTASEIMSLGDQGYSILKFFPAESSGGISFLKSIASPLPNFTFCPTGGITRDLAAKYLQLPNVICVGGSWMVNEALIRKRDWTTITKLATSAASLRTPD